MCLRFGRAGLLLSEASCDFSAWMRILGCFLLNAGLADLLCHPLKMGQSSGAVFGTVAGPSDGTLESVCYPGDLASW